jgi:LemA protein
MRAGRIAAAAGSALLLACGLDLVSARRQLIAGRRTVDHAFAQAEVALAQRAGAMAAFAGAVAGADSAPPVRAGIGRPDLERTPIDAMLASRAWAIGARTRFEKIAADERVERVLARLALFEETHPDLRSADNFENLEHDLAAAESRVAIARGDYNDAVLRYNASLASFPRNIAARIFGFRPENDYFRPDAGSESTK